MTGRAVTERPAAFLDRDGVINVDLGYVYQPEKLAFTPTAIKGIRLLNEAGYWVLVLTNQSGVARGYHGLPDVERFNTHLAQAVADGGGRIDAFYVSPYHPEGSVAEFAIEHEDRKPGTGMFRRAMNDWPVRREGSFMIGDKPSDIQAAEAAGFPAELVERDICDLAGTVRSMLGRWAR